MNFIIKIKIMDIVHIPRQVERELETRVAQILAGYQDFELPRVSKVF